MKKNKIILADDHIIVREGIRVLLEEDEINEVVYEASNGLEVLDYLKKNQPDMIIMDLSMPKLNGIFTTKRIKKIYPYIKVLILSRHDAKEYILEAIKAGTDGYVVKKSASNELMTAVRNIFNGGMYFSPSISKVIIKKLITQNISDKDQKQLTGRENEIYQLLAEGYSSKEIAKSLFISIETVFTHRKNIMRKLNVKNITQLTKHAIKTGVVELNVSPSFKE